MNDLTYILFLNRWSAYLPMTWFTDNLPCQKREPVREIEKPVGNSE